MFFGQYCHSIDTKGRLTVPAKYRDLLVDGAYLTQGFDANLMVLTEATFNELSQHISKMSFTDQRARILRRLLFSTADRVELDSNGRILLPQFLRETAHLNEEAYLVGAGIYIEIWSPIAWQEQLTLLNDTEANAERFSGLDLLAGSLE